MIRVNPRERRCELREILPARWSSFLRGFSERNRGRPVTIETDTEAPASALRERTFALEAIAVHRDHRQGLTLLLRTSPESIMRHSIAAPAGIILLEAFAGGDDGLFIQRADGAATLLRLRSYARSISQACP